MIEILIALALGAHQAADEAIDAAFAQLDDRYFAMLMSSVDASSTAAAEGPGNDGAVTAQCLHLLTPVQRELNLRTLRREMRLFATVTPEARAEVFEVARATATVQATDIRLRLNALELTEGTCRTIPAYRMEKQRMVAVLLDTQSLLSTIANQPPTSAPPVE